MSSDHVTLCPQPKTDWDGTAQHPPILPFTSRLHKPQEHWFRSTGCPEPCVTFERYDCCLRLFSHQQRFLGSKLDLSFIPVALIGIFFSELLSVLITWCVVRITFVALRLIPSIVKHIKKYVNSQKCILP